MHTAGLGSILDTVSKILKDTAIFSICILSKIHFALRVSYRIFQILYWAKDTDTLKLPSHARVPRRFRAITPHLGI